MIYESPILLSVAILIAADAFSADVLPYNDVRIRGDDAALNADVIYDSAKDVNRLTVDSNSVPSGTGNRFYEFFYNTIVPPSKDMMQDCDAGSYSASKCIFLVNSVSNDVLLTNLKCSAYCDDGVRNFDDFSCSLNPLTNGLRIKIKSENITLTFQDIKNNGDFENYFAGKNGFYISDVDDDYFSVNHQPIIPYVIKKTGTYGTDDYISIEIRDDIDETSGNWYKFECYAEGIRL